MQKSNFLLILLCGLLWLSPASAQQVYNERIDTGGSYEVAGEAPQKAGPSNTTTYQNNATTEREQYPSARPAGQPMQPGQSAMASQPLTPGTPGVTVINGVATGPVPVFGSQLFSGNFAAERDQSMNPGYIITMGDRLSVQTWGTVTINDVFVVDGQGNIFLPDIGPVKVAGLANSALTAAVRRSVQKIYRDGFDVYTNVLNAKPVGVMVTGRVEKPGRYAGVPSDSIFYYLDRAGGIQPDVGSYRHVEVLRDGEKVHEVDLYKFLLDGKIPTIQFMDGDSIVVKKRGPVVTLLGNVATPARLEFADSKVKGQDALEIIPEAVNAMQISVEGMRSGANFKTSLTLSEFREFALSDGDVVTLTTNPAADKILVYIEGQYEGPNVLAVKNGTRLLDVLHRIPVDSNLVEAKAIHIRRESVKLSQKQQIQQALNRLEKEVMLAMSKTQGESAIRVQEADLVQAFVQRASQIEPLGQVVTSRGGEQQNILLEPGDTIVIPRRSNVVEVSGEVFMTQAVVYQPEYSVGDYVEQAGGYGQRADTGHIIILKTSGEAVVKGYLGGGGDIEPGDKILVPPKADSKLFQNAMDFTEVIYQIAIAAGVVAGL